MKLARSFPLLPAMWTTIMRRLVLSTIGSLATAATSGWTSNLVAVCAAATLGMSGSSTRAAVKRADRRGLKNNTPAGLG